MNKIAILPLRAGSKSIPNKNKKRLLGRPLFSWVLTEAIFSNLDEIYVFTDDLSIIEYVKEEYKWSKKVKTFKRSEESATDFASTETGMMELAEAVNFNFDIYCLLQATSPLTTRYDINRVIEKVQSEAFDSALTVVEAKRFIWNAVGESLNYNYLNRPRRQDFNGLLIENGAVYATTRDNFIKTHNRLGGKISIVRMSDDSLVEIDEPTDFIVMEELLRKRLLKKKINSQKVKILCLDVDGVLTKATIHVSKDGEFSKEFSYRDGMGLQLLREEGIEVFVLTSEDSEIIKKRMAKLKIDNVYTGVKDKYFRLEWICAESGIERNEIVYIGDDINDLSNVLSCGLSLCPKDAQDRVKESADVILQSNGGERAVREACEFIIKMNAKNS